MPVLILEDIFPVLVETDEGAGTRSRKQSPAVRAGSHDDLLEPAAVSGEDDASLVFGNPDRDSFSERAHSSPENQHRKPSVQG